MKKSLSLIKIMAVFCVFLCLCSCSKKVGDETDTQAVTESDNSSEITFLGEVSGIRIMTALEYSYPEAENSTDGEASGISGLAVVNNTDRTLEYMLLLEKFSDGTVYSYKITTLPGGECCYVSEQNGGKYRDFNKNTDSFSSEECLFFSEEPSLMSDSFNLTKSDGILTVKNISGENIDAPVYIYYKSIDENGLLFGETYRVALPYGIESDKTEQIEASHLHQKGSRILFVEVISGEEQ